MSVIPSVLLDDLVELAGRDARLHELAEVVHKLRVEARCLPHGITLHLHQAQISLTKKHRCWAILGAPKGIYRHWPALRRV
jgi:hypothetical protein